MRAPDSRALAWIFVVALVLRLAFVLAYPQFPFGLADDRGYDEVAWNLATGHGFTAVPPFAPAGAARVPVIDIGPGYPAFLAGIYAIAGHNLTAVRAAQAIVSALTVLLVWGLAREAGASPAATRTAAWITALYPVFIAYCGVVLSETLFTFGVAASTLLTMRAMRDRRWSSWAIAGAVLGATILVRSEALAFVPLIVLIAVVTQTTRERLLAVAAFVVVCAVVVGAWTTRNYRTFGELVTVSANGGRTLWISTKGWDEWRPQDPELRRLTAGLDALQVDHVLGAAAMQNIKAAPVDYLISCVRRIPQFWIGSHTTYIVGVTESFGTYASRREYGRLAAKAMMLGADVLLLIAAIGGAARLVWSRADAAAWVLLVPIAGIAAVHVFYFATARYAVPVLPLIVVLASMAIVVSGEVRVGAAHPRAGRIYQ